VSISRSIKGRIFLKNDEIKIVTLESNVKERLFVTKRQYFKNDKDKLDIRGLRKRTWLAIADPFEIGRVLGTSARGMETITKEMKRALALLHEGLCAEIFIEYNRRERVQLPPFPFRALSKKDPVDMTGITKSGGLRMQFSNSWDQLIDVLSLLEKKEKDQIDVSTFRCFCFMNRLGMPSERELENLGLIKGNRLALPSNKGQNARDLKPKTHREPRQKPPIVAMVSQKSGQSTIASARKELLKHHPDKTLVRELVMAEPKPAVKGTKKLNDKPKGPVMTGKQIGTM
jgi:hypothetical protein